jgi:siroheme synthase
MLAIYMGLGAAGHIQARLLAGGIDPATPVTLVENGTLPGQKVAVGMIGRLVDTLIEASIKGPAMIFVGARPQTSSRPDVTSCVMARHRAPANLRSEELAA